MTPPVTLTIAGSDSGGAAGIQADLTTAAALGVHGTAAITAVTAQNTVGVQDVHQVPVAMIDAQITSVLDDLPVTAAKTGMLGTTGTVDAVATRAEAGRLPPLVVDPVMVATSGDRLLEPRAESAYRDRLLPRALVATPNLAEAAVLAGEELRSVDDVRRVTDRLAALGATYLVVTGGHGTGEAVDLVLHEGEWIELTGPRLGTSNDHGSGCTFTAAITAYLAHGVEPLEAIRRAKAFVAERLAVSADWALGRGRGPVAHVVGRPERP